VIAYFDTSAILPLIVEEPTSELAVRLWNLADRVMSVRLLYPEGRAALAQARWSGRLSPRQARAAGSRFDELFHQVDVIEITEHLAFRAGELAEQHHLRGYDAVHLAGAEMVSDPDTVLVAGDRPLCDAAGRLGMSVARL